MNEFAHFFTGVLFSLIFTNNYYEYIIAGYFAFFADYDCFLSSIITHGVETHRIIIGFLFYLSPCLIILYLLKTKRIIYYACIGLSSHLFLDSFTYSYKQYNHHVYLWPINNFSFHFDTIFSSVNDPWHWRVVIEIIYTSLLIGFIIFYFLYKYLKKKYYLHHSSLLTSEFYIININPDDDLERLQYVKRLKYITISILTSFVLYFFNCFLPDLILTWS
jgi:hypothetical protein